MAPPPSYSSVVSEIIHEGIIMYVLTILSHMVATVIHHSTESDAPQTEAFEVTCKVAIGKNYLSTLFFTVSLWPS